LVDEFFVRHSPDAFAEFLDGFGFKTDAFEHVSSGRKQGEYFIPVHWILVRAPPKPKILIDRGCLLRHLCHILRQ
jgi:hypothetical protein